MADLEITTYVRCREDALTELLQRYANLLQSIGFTDQHVQEQLANVTWEPDGSGFGFLGEPLASDVITMTGHPVIARPYILGYTDAAIAGLKLPWVQLSLMFEGRMVDLFMDRISGKMRPGAGAVIWRIAQDISKEFHESGVFFNDSPTVNEPWYSLTDREGNLWAFDLALIPEHLAALFWPVPEGYTPIRLSEALGLARLVSWESVPWTEGYSERLP